MRKLAVLALVALVVPLAGCLDDAADPGLAQVPAVKDIAAEVQAALAGLPCEASVGGTTDNSANLRQLSAISIPVEKEGTIHAELDIGGDYGAHARYSTSGFELYDLTDPLSPRNIGNWTHVDESGEPILDGALDVKFTPDNATVLVGAGDGILAVDVRDPNNMRLVGQWSRQDGAPALDEQTGVLYNPHMLSTARIAGADWVFMAPNSNSGVWILKMEGPPEERTFTYVTNTLPVEGGPLGPHDMYVGKDTLDGNWYLYSADGFQGWTVFNVNDPANPILAGGQVNPAELAYTHTLQAKEINGKRIVATIAEVGVNRLRIFDATNLLAPILLGEWRADITAPTNPEHNLNIVGGKLYFAYYSYGMYVFDLEEFTAGLSLPVVGTATLAPAAHWSVGTEPTDGALAFEGFWDVVLKDGIIYVSHIEGGLVVLGYGCNAFPDADLTSDG